MKSGRKKLFASRSTKVSDVSLNDSEQTFLLSDQEIVDCRLLKTLFYKSAVSLALSSESLAWAQQQFEAVIAAERLHQRALEGNGGIKMGTAGTYRRAGCFFFYFARPLFHMCSTCASQSLAPNTRPAGSTSLADWKLPWWRWKLVMKKGGARCKPQHGIFLI